MRDPLIFMTILETIESQENREIWHGVSRLLPRTFTFFALALAGHSHTLGCEPPASILSRHHGHA